MPVILNYSKKGKARAAQSKATLRAAVDRLRARTRSSFWEAPHCDMTATRFFRCFPDVNEAAAAIDLIVRTVPLDDKVVQRVTDYLHFMLVNKDGCYEAFAFPTEAPNRSSRWSAFFVAAADKADKAAAGEAPRTHWLHRFMFELVTDPRVIGPTVLARKWGPTLYTAEGDGEMHENLENFARWERSRFWITAILAATPDNDMPTTPVAVLRRTRALSSA